MLEALIDRICALQCEVVCWGADEPLKFNSVNFKFMVWDHTANNVRMGCVASSGGDMQFVVRSESVGNGRRLFVGTPYVADESNHLNGRELASVAVVDHFLREMQSVCSLNANVVFDGGLELDQPVSLHLQFGHPIAGKTLLLKDVVKCTNLLFVIEMFQ